MPSYEFKMDDGSAYKVELEDGADPNDESIRAEVIAMHEDRLLGQAASDAPDDILRQDELNQARDKQPLEGDTVDFGSQVAGSPVDNPVELQSDFIPDQDFLSTSVQIDLSNEQVPSQARDIASHFDSVIDTETGLARGYAEELSQLYRSAAPILESTSISQAYVDSFNSIRDDLTGKYKAEVESRDIDQEGISRVREAKRKIGSPGGFLGDDFEDALFKDEVDKLLESGEITEENVAHFQLESGDEIGLYSNGEVFIPNSLMLDSDENIAESAKALGASGEAIERLLKKVDQGRERAATALSDAFPEGEVKDSLANGGERAIGIAQSVFEAAQDRSRGGEFVRGIGKGVVDIGVLINRGATPIAEVFDAVGSGNVEGLLDRRKSLEAINKLDDAFESLNRDESIWRDVASAGGRTLPSMALTIGSGGAAAGFAQAARLGKVGTGIATTLAASTSAGATSASGAATSANEFYRSERGLEQLGFEDAAEAKSILELSKDQLEGAELTEKRQRIEDKISGAVNKRALSSGLTEAVVTGAFSAMGLGAVEDVLASRIINDGKLKASLIKNIVKGAGSEIPEELIITTVNSAFGKFQDNPDATLSDFVKELKVTALVAGGFGIAGGIAKSSKNNRPDNPWSTSEPIVKLAADLSTGQEIDPENIEASFDGAPEDIDSIKAKVTADGPEVFQKKIDSHLEKSKAFNELVRSEEGIAALDKSLSELEEGGAEPEFIAERKAFLDELKSDRGLEEAPIETIKEAAPEVDEDFIARAQLHSDVIAAKKKLPGKNNENVTVTADDLIKLRDEIKEADGVDINVNDAIQLLQGKRPDRNFEEARASEAASPSDVQKTPDIIELEEKLSSAQEELDSRLREEAEVEPVATSGFTPPSGTETGTLRRAVDVAQSRLDKAKSEAAANQKKAPVGDDGTPRDIERFNRLSADDDALLGGSPESPDEGSEIAYNAARKSAQEAEQVIIEQEEIAGEQSALPPLGTEPLIPNTPSGAARDTESLQDYAIQRTLARAVLGSQGFEIDPDDLDGLYREVITNDDGVVRAERLVRAFGSPSNLFSNVQRILDGEKVVVNFPDSEYGSEAGVVGNYLNKVEGATDTYTVENTGNFELDALHAMRAQMDGIRYLLDNKEMPQEERDSLEGQIVSLLNMAAPLGTKSGRILQLFRYLTADGWKKWIESEGDRLISAKLDDNKEELEAIKQAAAIKISEGQDPILESLMEAINDAGLTVDEAIDIILGGDEGIDADVMALLHRIEELEALLAAGEGGGQQLSPAERVAQGIVASLNVTDPETGEVDPASITPATLIQAAIAIGRDRLPNAPTIPSDPAKARKQLEQLLGSREEMSELFEAAKEILVNRFADDEAALIQLQSVFERVVGVPFSDGLAQKALIEQLKENGYRLSRPRQEGRITQPTPIPDLLDISAESAEQEVNQAIQQISEGMTPEEMDAIAINAQGLTQAARDKAVNTFLNKKTPTKDKHYTDRYKSLLRFLNAGGLDNPSAYMSFMDKMTTQFGLLLPDDGIDLYRKVGASIRDASTIEEFRDAEASLLGLMRLGKNASVATLNSFRDSGVFLPSAVSETQSDSREARKPLVRISDLTEPQRQAVIDSTAAQMISQIGSEPDTDVAQTIRDQVTKVATDAARADLTSILTVKPVASDAVPSLRFQTMFRALRLMTGQDGVLRATHLSDFKKKFKLVGTDTSVIQKMANYVNLISAASTDEEVKVIIDTVAEIMAHAEVKGFDNNHSYKNQKEQLRSILFDKDSGRLRVEKEFLAEAEALMGIKLDDHPKLKAKIIGDWQAAFNRIQRETLDKLNKSSIRKFKKKAEIDGRNVTMREHVTRRLLEAASLGLFEDASVATKNEDGTFTRRTAEDYATEFFEEIGISSYSKFSDEDKARLTELGEIMRSSNPGMPQADALRSAHEILLKNNGFDAVSYISNMWTAHVLASVDTTATIGIGAIATTSLSVGSQLAGAIVQGIFQGQGLSIFDAMRKSIGNSIEQSLDLSIGHVYGMTVSDAGDVSEKFDGIDESTSSAVTTNASNPIRAANIENAKLINNFKQNVKDVFSKKVIGAVAKVLAAPTLAASGVSLTGFGRIWSAMDSVSHVSQEMQAIAEVASKKRSEKLSADQLLRASNIFVDKNDPDRVALKREIDEEADLIDFSRDSSPEIAAVMSKFRAETNTGRRKAVWKKLRYIDRTTVVDRDAEAVTSAARIRRDVQYRGYPDGLLIGPLTFGVDKAITSIQRGLGKKSADSKGVSKFAYGTLATVPFALRHSLTRFLHIAARVATSYAEYVPVFGGAKMLPFIYTSESGKLEKRRTTAPERYIAATRQVIGSAIHGMAILAPLALFYGEDEDEDGNKFITFGPTAEGPAALLDGTASMTDMKNARLIGKDSPTQATYSFMIPNPFTDESIALSFADVPLANVLLTSMGRMVDADRAGYFDGMDVQTESAVRLKLLMSGFNATLNTAATKRLQIVINNISSKGIQSVASDMYVDLAAALAPRIPLQKDLDIILDARNGELNSTIHDIPLVGRMLQFYPMADAVGGYESIDSLGESIDKDSVGRWTANRIPGLRRLISPKNLNSRASSEIIWDLFQDAAVSIPLKSEGGKVALTKKQIEEIRAVGTPGDSEHFGIMFRVLETANELPPKESQRFHRLRGYYVKQNILALLEARGESGATYMSQYVAAQDALSSATNDDERRVARVQLATFSEEFQVEVDKLAPKATTFGKKILANEIVTGKIKGTWNKDPALLTGDDLVDSAITESFSAPTIIDSVSGEAFIATDIDGNSAEGITPLGARQNLSRILEKGGE